MKRAIDACIVELRGRYAAALTGDGQFVRVRNRGYSVGQTVRLTEAHPESNPGRRVRALTSIVAGLLFLILGGFKGYQTPVGVVSLDVNPSIEYTINAFDRVLGVRGVNEDGQTLLEGMDTAEMNNQPVGDAVEQTINTLRESGYFQQDLENDVVLAASSYSAQHADRLAEELKSCVSQEDDLTILSFSVSREEVEQAHSLGASAGKVRIVQQLEQSNQAGKDFDQKDWLNKPVREILDQTQGQPQEQTQQQAPSSAPQQDTSLPQSSPPPAPGATPNPVMSQPGGEPYGGQQPDGSLPSASPTVSPKSGSLGGKQPSGSGQQPRK